MLLSHQAGIFTVVRAIECRQRLPAFRREPRDIGVSDVAKYFESNGSIAVLVVGVTLSVTLSSCDRRAACTPASRTANSIAAVRNACRIGRMNGTVRSHGMRVAGRWMDTGLIVAGPQ